MSDSVDPLWVWLRPEPPNFGRLTFRLGFLFISANKWEKSEDEDVTRPFPPPPPVTPAGLVIPVAPFEFKKEEFADSVGEWEVGGFWVVVVGGLLTMLTGSVI